VESFFSPFIWILDTIYHFNLNLFANHGLSLILLSIEVSIIMLPFYWIAEYWKTEEEGIQAKMYREIERLKRCFSGQKRFLLIREVHRIHGYKSWYAVRASFGLILQIPFFFAAYMFLSNYTGFEGVSFGPIQDLAKQDSLLSGYSLLPFAMTVANLFSLWFYSKGKKLSEKVQGVVLALFFLALLYSRPAGLLIYWTMNNILSIPKSYWFALRFPTVLPEQDLNKKSILQSVTELFKKYRMVLNYTLLYICSYLFVLNSFADFLTARYSEYLLIGLLDLLIVFSLIYFLEKHSQLQNTKKRALLICGFFLLLGVAFFHLGFILNKLSIHTFFDFLHRNLIRDLIIYSQSFYLLVFFAFTKGLYSKKSLTPDKLSKQDLYKLLIPLGLVVSYIVPNRNYFSFDTFTLYLGMLFIIPILLFFLIRFVLREVVRHEWIVLSFLSFSVALFMMPKIMGTVSPSQDSVIVYQIVIFSMVSLLFATILFKSGNNAKFLAVSFFLVFTIESTLPLFKSDDSGITKIDETYEVLKHLSEIEAPKTKLPNVYYLGFDSYVDQSVSDFYGIDNSSQIEWIESQGFDIYPDTYSIGGDTVSSLARMLEMSRFLGSSQSRAFMGYSQVNDIFQDLGYKTHYILEDYFLMGTIAGFNGDYIFPQGKGISKYQTMYLIVRNILRGNFDDSVEGMSFGGSTLEEQISDIIRLSSLENETPLFLFTHFSIPGHAPNLENKRSTFEAHAKDFGKNLKTANLHMTTLIHSIIENDPNAIIILAGDHGPFLMGKSMKFHLTAEKDLSKERFLDAYSTFLAVRWPEKSEEREILILQNLFFSVFSYLYEDDDVLNYTLSTDTLKRGASVEGAISEGIITIGPDKGYDLRSSH
jgi:60Kd inner membrane protein